MATALKDLSVHLSDPSLLRQQCYIDGAWLDADGRATIEVQDPASGEVIGTVPRMGVAETRRAIEAAARAFESWRRTTAKQRAAILRKWFDLMMANQEDLAVIMTREQGKPLAESRGEIAYGAAFVEWYAEEAKRVYGDIIPTIADRLKAGKGIEGLALESALWCRYCYGTTDSGAAIEPNDPNWERMTKTAKAAKGDPSAWLGMGDIYGEVGRNAVFAEAFSRHLKALWRDGARATLERYVAA